MPIGASNRPSGQAGLIGNPVQIRDCPAAVSGNERLTKHWPQGSGSEASRRAYWSASMSPKTCRSARPSGEYCVLRVGGSGEHRKNAFDAFDSSLARGSEKLNILLETCRVSLVSLSLGYAAICLCSAACRCVLGKFRFVSTLKRSTTS